METRMRNFGILLSSLLAAGGCTTEDVTRDTMEAKGGGMGSPDAMLPPVEVPLDGQGVIAVGFYPRNVPAARVRVVLNGEVITAGTLGVGASMGTLVPAGTYAVRLETLEGEVVGVGQDVAFVRPDAETQVVFYGDLGAMSSKVLTPDLKSTRGDKRVIRGMNLTLTGEPLDLMYCASETSCSLVTPVPYGAMFEEVVSGDAAGYGLRFGGCTPSETDDCIETGYWRYDSGIVVQMTLGQQTFGTYPFWDPYRENP